MRIRTALAVLGCAAVALGAFALPAEGPRGGVPTVSDQDCTNSGGNSNSFGSRAVCHGGQGHNGEAVPNNQQYPYQRDRQDLRQGQSGS
jgi:cytochrome c553